MWVVYRRSDRKAVGMSAHSEVELDKQVALEEVVRGLASPEPPGAYDAAQVTDRAEALAVIRARRDQLRLGKGADGELRLTIAKPVAPKMSGLTLSSDAPDVHPVDSVPEIPADGASSTKIAVQKVDERGQPLTDRADADTLYLRTDYGTLLNADGTEAIKTIKLKKGHATFRLMSEKARRLATVQVFNADSNLRDARIRVEFT